MYHSVLAIIDGTPHLNTEQRQKRQICGFLARIMHGKHLGKLTQRYFSFVLLPFVCLHCRYQSVLIDPMKLNTELLDEVDKKRVCCLTSCLYNEFNTIYTFYIEVEALRFLRETGNANCLTRQDPE